MRNLLFILSLTVPFTSSGKPIQGIIIGSSDDTSGFPSYDYYLDPPIQRNNKNFQTSKQPILKNGDRISHITLTKQVPYPVPHPVPYPVVEKVHYPVKIEVPVKIDQPYEVKVYKPYAVRVEKPIPYQVIKNVPIPVKVPVNVPVPIKIPVLVPQPYPVKITKNVPVPDPETIIVKKPVLVYISSDGKTEGESDITEDGGSENNDATQLESDDLNCNTKSDDTYKGIQILTRYGYSNHEINNTDGLNFGDIQQSFVFNNNRNQLSFKEHQNQQALKYHHHQQNSKDRRTPQTFLDQQNQDDLKTKQFHQIFEDHLNQQRIYKDHQIFENNHRQVANHHNRHSNSRYDNRMHHNRRISGMKRSHSRRNHVNGNANVRYGGTNIPKQNFGRENVIMVITDMPNRNFIDGKQNFDSVRANVSQNLGVSAQLKTIQSYMSKSEDSSSVMDEKATTHNFKGQQNNEAEDLKNNQDQRYMKSVTDGKSRPRKIHDAENFFRNDNPQFKASEFTGLGAYATHSQGQHH